MKYPVVIPYISDGNNGSELKYALRSLKYATNFNGEVVIIGDKEDWYKNIKHYNKRRFYGKPYIDQKQKMLLACEIYDSFIASMDDVYITQKQSIKNHHRGELPTEYLNMYQKSKVETRKYLEGLGLSTLDYECHTPMRVNSKKLKETLEFIVRKPLIQWRSVYGNMWKIKSNLYEDRKARTKELPKGKIISTSYYTDELNKLFPKKSKYEL